MANNAYYGESELYKFPSYIVEVDRVDKGYGFQAIIYKVSPETLIEGDALLDSSKIVIAYRGTEGFADWLWGNLFGKQYELANELYKEIKSKYPDYKIVATGHSLGGGLALHISVVEEGVPAYVFNPSYRIHREGEEKDNKSVVIAETGDILKIQRLPWKNPENIDPHEEFYCSKIGSHSIFALSRCLNHVAAYNPQNIKATESLKVNQVSICNSKK
ncbi:lipase family protein [Vibrio europaeus]|uniref:lipase family protein n=1 Tax=Vibrio europaeus TaxID=300876 RepID=UPI00233EEBEC|nr:hypothetical protein [Vibrio europaeus]MDC5853572.1 hypothetical protein [Vibrio europaeus]